jgi:hypothetical protein
MKHASAIGRRALSLAAGFALLLPQAAVVAQCPEAPLAPPPTRQLAIGPPSSRVCCIFSFALALDPTKLAGHVYGNGNDLDAATSQTKEPVGYVYTAAAGLVDIGHVRDNADMTLWVYANLLIGSHNIQVGNDTAFVPTIPTGKAQLLAMAGAIVYTSSWAHELVTWGDSPILPSSWLGPEEDYSAFSPEDLPSNIVGIETATRAINAGGDASPAAFSHQMDLALAQMMTELGAQPAAETTKLLAQVQLTSADKNLLGKWWIKNYTVETSNFGVRLIRRNFDGTAWKIAGAPQAATPAWHNTTRFSALYGQFLYFMSKDVVADLTQTPLTTAYALTGWTTLRWEDLLTGAIPQAATLQQAIGGGSCLVVPKTNTALGTGQYATIEVNDYPTQVNIIAKMKDATDAIHNQFVHDNSCLPGQPCTLPAGAQDAGPMDGP